MILILIFTSKLTAQIEDVFICGGVENQKTVMDPGELIGVTYTLKILLVEFSDIHHKPNITYTNWNNLFFSSGIYVSPNMYSPDGQQVFGSMKDYYSIMSDGYFNLNGYVVNQDANGDQVPDWLTLPLSKQYYDQHGWGTFESAVFTAASNAGLDITTSSTTKLAIIYAGHTYRGDNSGLWPHANYLGGTYYTNGELFAEGPPFHSDHPQAKFSEIGINVHEFGHLLGVPDIYDNGFFDVMNAGNYTGPASRGACPAPFNPQSRYKKGWVSFTPITTDQTFQSDYDLRDPEVFKIANSNDPNNYFLIETRDLTSTMTIGTTVTDDYNSWIYKTFYSSYPEKRVFIWRIVNNNNGTVLQANGVRWSGYPQLSKGTPFSGTGNVKVCSP